MEISIGEHGYRDASAAFSLFIAVSDKNSKSLIVAKDMQHQSLNSICENEMLYCDISSCQLLPWKC